MSRTRRRVRARERRERPSIRELNDRFRQTLSGGNVLITNGVAALGRAHTASLLGELKRYDDFNADNDPYGEHELMRLRLHRAPLLLEDRLLRSRLKARIAQSGRSELHHSCADADAGGGMVRSSRSMNSERLIPSRAGAPQRSLAPQSLIENGD